jgi:PEP-CTERM motif
MVMTKVLGAIVALVAATAAHAQLSAESTTGTFVSETAGTYDVYFALPALGPFLYYGSGTLDFTLASAADVTFSGSTSSPFAIGMLSGSGLTSPLLVYNEAVNSTTVDLAAGSYVYTATGFAFVPANVYVDVSAVSAVPEPQTYGMLLAGLALAGIAVQRRRTPAFSPSLAVSC